MPSFAAVMSEDRRLIILRILALAPRYTANHFVLTTLLDTQYRHVPGEDVIRADLSWLAEVGLITVEVLERMVDVATLTTRGLDVSAGRSTCPGVRRPRPGE